MTVASNCYAVRPIFLNAIVVPADSFADRLSCTGTATVRGMSVVRDAGRALPVITSVTGRGHYRTAGSAPVKRQVELFGTALPDLASRSSTNWATETGSPAGGGPQAHTGPLHLPGGPAGPAGQPVCSEEIRIDRYHDERITGSWFVPEG